MRIGFVSSGDIYDRRSWSGTISFLAGRLSGRHEVVPIVVNDIWKKYFNKLVTVATLGRRHHSRFPLYVEKLVLAHRIKRSHCDLYFAPAVSEMVACGGIPEDVKVVYLSDATYHLMLDYYLFNETPYDREYSNEMEERALSRADAVILSSDWAVNDARRYYGIEQDKLHRLCFGANLPDRYSSVAKNLDSGRPVRLLLVGVDWERKGIDIAIETVRSLNGREDGRSYELTIVGFDGPRDAGSMDAHVHYAGRLDKNSSEELNMLVRRYQDSDLFILPTRAECAGIVFSEAAMYGLPTFTYATGGVESYVESGVTGVCLPPGSDAERFADVISTMVHSGDYAQYSAQARAKYEAELNWDVWFREFESILEGLMGR